MGDEGVDVGGRGAARIDQDVGMPRGDQGAADPGAFQAALVDQTAGPDAFDLLEDGAGARLGVGAPELPRGIDATFALDA